MNSLYPQQNMSLLQNNNIAQFVKNSANPGLLFQNIAKNNPQVQSIMQMIQQTNQTPKQLFYQMAQQRGVDPEQIIDMFK